MTGRTCAIHGEYSATGACRWCEPSEKYVGCACGEFALNGKPFEFVLPNMLHQPHRCAPWLTLGMGHLRSPPSWRIDYDDAARVAELDAEEESRLAAQHAALRWERVARRWESKHRRFNLKACDVNVFDGLVLDFGLADEEPPA
jgi:hypothetical protein